MQGNKKRVIDIKSQVKFIGKLNNAGTLHLVNSDNGNMIAKQIDLGQDYPKLKQMQETMMKKLYGSSQPLIYKPEFYDLENDNSLYLISKIYPLSLQNIIMYHRFRETNLNPVLVYTVVFKIYDMLNRIKNSGTDFYHNNLKPSNIFLTFSEDSVECHVSQCGIITKYPNKYYMRPMNVYSNIKGNKSTNMSFAKDSFEGDLYSLGVIALEMITLESIQTIYNNLMQEKTIESLSRAKDAVNYYGEALMAFIKQLLRPRDNIKEVYHQFKDNPPEFQKLQNYEEIAMTQQKLQKMVDNKTFESTIEQLKQEIARTQVQSQAIMIEAEKFDPDLNFYFKQYKEMRDFLASKKINIGLDEEKLFELCFYLLNCSTINYMDILGKALPTKDIIEFVVKKAIQNYSNKKEFFQAQTGGRQFWKSEDVCKFMATLGIRLQEKNVNQVVKQWSGINKRNSVKIDEFNKVFKGVGRDDASSKTQRSIKSQSSEKSLRDLLLQLQEKIPQQNLVQFFRTFDQKGKWVVGPNIDREIKKFVVVGDRLFKELCDQMWQLAGIFGEKDKVLQYITLLKLKKVYDPVNLFKMVLTEKINQIDREKFYRKYEKEGKGWSYHSLQDFNEDEQLDFDERQLKNLFSELDKDKSQYLTEKQLIFQLTGLKQFDLEFLVEKIKVQSSGKWDLFHIFLQNDRNKDLYLDTPGDISAVFAEMNIELPINHYQILFEKFQRSSKFQYLVFLRFFIDIPTLFKKSCIFIIDELYNGSFDKFFEVGLSQGRRKWNRQSLIKVNEELVLGFSNNEVGQIWDDFDKLKDGSLTKAEIAKIFKFECQPEEPEGSLLGLDSVEKFYPGQYTSKKTVNEQKMTSQKKKKDNIIEQTHKSSSVIDSNEVFKKIRQKGLLSVALTMAKMSRKSGSVTFDDFCKGLENLQIRLTRNLVLRNTSNFQIQDNQTKATHINYVSLLMFICQAETYDEADENQRQRLQQENKFQCLMTVLKEIIQNKGLQTEDIFKKCKNFERMRLTDYENFIKDTLQIEIYFDDIEETWKFVGQPDYLTQDDFNNMLKVNKSRMNQFRPPPMQKQFSFARQNNNNDNTISSNQARIKKERKDSIEIRESFGRQDSSQSPHFPMNTRIRKSSNDSKNQPNTKGQAKKQLKLNLNETIEEPSEREKLANQKIMPPKPSNKRPSLEDKVQLTFDRGNTLKKGQQKRKIISKAEVLQKLANKLQQKGSQPFNQLYSRSSNVSTQQFITFIEENYDFTPQQATKLGQQMNTFGRVKMQTLKKYIKKQQKAKSPQQVEKRNQFSGQNSSPFKNQREEKKQGGSKFRKTTENSPNKPSVKEKDVSGYKLIDPRKTKINIPLIKEHIRILMSSFSKRFDIHEMQPFFFQGNTQINQQQFIKKCQQINGSISVSMYEKIFLFLKPKMGFVSSVSFKINFTFDQQIQYDQSYLPEDLEQDIKAVFDKADKDKSGHIEINQIQTLLSALGLNQTQKQIQNYFEKIDQNFDKKVSFKEFKIFIEDNIFPYLSDFDEEVDSLLGLLKMNDVFRTGSISSPVIGGVMEKYGVKLSDADINSLNRYLSNENGQIPIKQLINSLYYPSQPNFPAPLKSVLYKIRWKKKVSFKDVQKIFENISTCFVTSYTSMIRKKKMLVPSSFITPVLHESRMFYKDFFYKNMTKITDKEPNLVSEIKPIDLLVQLHLIQATGLPIPQNTNIKSSILKRSVNVIFFDTSMEEGKDCMTSLDVQFDPDIEDQWNFDKNNRNIIVKVANFDARKYQKVLILFQFIVTMIDKDKSIDISCGSCSFPLRQLQGIDSKITRKYKLIAGIPSKSKDIDRMSVSKRKGIRSLFSMGEIDSQFQIQLIPHQKFAQKVGMMAALPQKCIINRKAIHLMYTFRQYFAVKSTDGKRINPDFCNHFLVKTFLLCLDVPDIHDALVLFWKDKIQPRVSSNIFNACRILFMLLKQLFLVIHSKQFDLLPSFPSKSTLSNKGLQSTRKKLINQVFANCEAWISAGIQTEYKRKKNYGIQYTPFKIEQKEIDQNTYAIAQGMVKSRS